MFHFQEGLRHGEFRVETFNDGLRVIVGSYERDMLNGKAKITYNDDTSMEGYFKVDNKQDLFFQILEGIQLALHF